MTPYFCLLAALNLFLCVVFIQAQGPECNVTRQPKVLTFSTVPTPTPATYPPVWTQSTPPVSQPEARTLTTTNPTSTPSSAPTSVGDECVHQMKAIEYSQVVGASSFQPDRSPIQITAQDGATVTFMVHQAWKKSDTLSSVATEYKDPVAGWTCPKAETVSYGPIRKFTALCDASGWTNVKLYVHDGTFQGPDEAIVVPQYCSPSLDSAKTVPFFFKFPCNPGCYPVPFECTNVAELDHGVGSQGYASNPIEIVSQDTVNVSFRVLQTWVSQPLCFVATHYPSTVNGVACERKDAVKPGSGGSYTAKCQGGSASVTLFVHDTSFDPVMNKAKVPDVCQPNADDRIASYTFRVPCEEPTKACVPTTEVTCASGIDHVVSFEDFEGSQDSPWTFGRVSRGQVSGGFLGPLETEVFRVFTVPKSPKASLLEFRLLQFGNVTSSGDKVYVRIRSQYLELMSFLGNLESRTGLFGDLRVSIQAQSTPLANKDAADKVFVASKLYEVAVTIPQRWYADGHLMIGFKSNVVNSTAAKSVGIDNLKITARCSLI